MTELSKKETRDKAALALRRFLLTGNSITQTAIPEGVGLPKYHLHSIVSTLRNELYFPVQSTKRGSFPFSTYSATEADIEQFNLGGEYRKAQKQRVRAEVLAKRLDRKVAATERMAAMLDDALQLPSEVKDKLLAAASLIIHRLTSAPTKKHSDQTE